MFLLWKFNGSIYIEYFVNYSEEEHAQRKTKFEKYIATIGTPIDGNMAVIKGINGL